MLQGIESPLNANRLLSYLTPDQQQQLLPELKPVSLVLGETLYLPNDSIGYVYFPTNSVVSLLATLENGETVETGLIGFEGMVGTSIALGVNISTSLALVQGNGEAFRLRAQALLPLVENGSQFKERLFKYIHALFTQTAQTAACNRVHPISERLARWLLLTHDRLKRDEFELTHELIARMLGTRRAGVSVAANTLRAEGLIDYSRGRVVMIDRRGLEAASCECYRVVKAEVERFSEN